MAKRKRTFKRRTTTKSFKSYKKKAKSENLTTLMVGSAIYGMGRSYLSNLIAPVTNKIPLGDITDEVSLGVLSYFVAKGKLSNNKTIKAIGKAGLTIESARVGEYALSQIMPNKSSVTSVTNSFR